MIERERENRVKKRGSETLSRGYTLERHQKKKICYGWHSSSFHILVFARKKRAKGRKALSLLLLLLLLPSVSLSPHPTMENHLLRHGEAMEAELKAMGAVQLGVRKRSVEKQRRERRLDDENSHRSCDRAFRCPLSTVPPCSFSFLSIAHARLFVSAWLRPWRLSSDADGI